ncbi:MAG: DUF3108 domain-containing protein [Candidatus Omnitrophica bacterium]|nr:DUF3108 domain-containing protein [Candidatus Omnitrophota bacterium]
MIKKFNIFFDVGLAAKRLSASLLPHLLVRRTIDVRLRAHSEDALHPDIFRQAWLLGAICLIFIVGCAPGMKPVALKDMPAVQEVSAVIASGATLPEHEKLVYQVKWLGITAGEIIAEIKGRVMWRGRSCYLIEVTARTTGFVSSMYKVDDLYRSYFDAERFYSVRHEEHRHEGAYHKDAVTDFDHGAGKAHFVNAADNTSKIFDIPSGVQDTITASYAVRLLPLAPGKSFAFKVSNSEKVYDLLATITTRSQMMHRGHVYDVLHLIPFAKIRGEEVREGRASGFFTDDARKIPLVVVIKAPVFTQVTATLVE